MKYFKVQFCKKISKHAKQILKALSFVLKVLLSSSGPLFCELCAYLKDRLTAW